MAKQKKGLALSLEGVMVQHVNVTAVAQEDGDAAMHDTIKLLAILSPDKLSDVMAALGLTKTKFMSNGPEQVPKVSIEGTYDRCECKLAGGFGGDNLVAIVGGATVLDFQVERLSSDAYNLTFKFKGIPDRNSHINFEEMWLGSETGLAWDLEIKPPPQAELDLDGADNKADNEQSEPA